ncbi:MAG: hypothetical protein HQK70_06575 [Desulfamplus sp.]|nr:hypothetical protein [Desulfamplus sp.]
MIEALKKAKANEIEILLIFDQRQMHNNQSIFFTLNNAGLTFRTLNIENASMHHKFIVIDDITTITGSFNWTHSAQKKNYENIVIIKDSVVTEQYKNEFDRIRQRITSNPIDDILKQKELLEKRLQEGIKEKEREEKLRKEREERLRKEREEQDKKHDFELAMFEIASGQGYNNAIRRIKNAASLGHREAQLWLSKHYK